MGRSWVDLMSYHPQLAKRICRSATSPEKAFPGRTPFFPPPFIIRAVAETLKLNPKEKIK